MTYQKKVVALQLKYVSNCLELTSKISAGPLERYL